MLVLVSVDQYHLFQVTHMKGSKTRRFTLNSPYKGIAKCMRYKNPAYTARTMLRVPSMKRATLAEIVSVSDSLW